MKNFVKVGFKSGASLDLEVDFVEFHNHLRSGATEFQNEVVSFLFSDVETIQSATQDEEIQELTKEQIIKNIASMEADLENFKEISEEVGETITTKDLMEKMSALRMKKLAETTIETE